MKYSFLNKFTVLLFFSLVCCFSFETKAQTFTEFSTTGPDAWHFSPDDITRGPDGNLWFTEYYVGYDRIGQITPRGQITEFSNGITIGSGLRAITLGPDGNLWFTQDAPRIGRITPEGVVTEFPIPIPATTDFYFRATGITSGPDGNLWFTESLTFPDGTGEGRIGRITPQGVVTQFTEGITQHPLDITSGPDGNLWFTECRREGQKIGKITTSGRVTEFPLNLPPFICANSITSGPDGNLWFTVGSGADSIGRITPSGVVTYFWEGVSAFSNPTDITLGPDGNLWFIEAVGRIGKITPAGRVTEYSNGTVVPFGYDHTPRYRSITVGPDNNIWFTTPRKVVRFNLNSSPTATYELLYPPIYYQPERFFVDDNPPDPKFNPPPEKTPSLWEKAIDYFK